MGPAATQGFFNDLRIFVSGAAKETQNRIHRTEKSVAVSSSLHLCFILFFWALEFFLWACWRTH